MIIDGCELVMDFERGVIYVHAPNGRTILRVCGCPRKPEPEDANAKDYDITLKGQRLQEFTFNW